MSAAFILPFLIFTNIVFANTLDQTQNFNVNETFDNFSRRSLTATLRHIGANAYFYVDDKFWDSLNPNGKNIVSNGMAKLSDEFDNTIYPRETLFWGQEPKPGIDGDNRIVILLEELKQGHGGYFSTSNGYSRSTAPESNEIEMIVIGADSVADQYAKTFLAHEFQHLISFNQKELLRNVTDDVWLNELRSEYAITQAGYNDFFTNSNLETRAKKFFENPFDSLTEWPNVNLDYSLAAIFAEYLAEQYGADLLKESLQTNFSGISSINSVLASRGSERFLDVFAEWLTASYINDNSINSKFGYTRLGLKNFKAAPQRLTVLSDSTTVFDYFLKPWQVYGHKFMASGSLSSGGKALKLSPSFNSRLAYADNLGRFSVFDKDFYVNDPEGGLQYFFIFPINDRKISDFGKKEDESVLSLSVAFTEKNFWYGLRFVTEKRRFDQKNKRK